MDHHNTQCSITLFRKATYGIILLAAILFSCCLPDALFRDPLSTVIYASNGDLCGAKIAADGQWRFPEARLIPARYAQAVIAYEDQRFFTHGGVDGQAIIRATIQNLKAGRIESGASTITMQVIRMSRKGKARTLTQKVIEAIMAIRLELSASKKEILSLYAENAPFGGNVVGLETAAWRYFAKPVDRLTWAESATLAVLPNAPSLIHPGKNRAKLLSKRNGLLEKLYEKGVIDAVNYQLSLLETIPEQPHPLPRYAPHLLEHFVVSSGIANSHLDMNIQQAALDVIKTHHQINRQKEINNAAVLVVDNTTGKVIAYIGNTAGNGHENAVDMVLARRSSGSILKPLLYAMMMQAGKLSPHQMLADVPTTIDGFNPKNYDKSYSGAVKASDALAKSLNVPAVKMLQEYGVEAFRSKAEKLGLRSLNKSADHYGLSLILGGGEVRLWDLVDVYSRMAQKLNFYGHDKLPVSIHTSGIGQPQEIVDLDAGVIYSTFQAMRKVIRPSSEGQWEQFTSSVPMAWKTGTSYGHRDAWAIGVTPKYTIGAWVGNADGEGRPDIIGSSAAGTLLFDVLNILPHNGQWFNVPHDELKEIPTCATSGFIATAHCEKTDTLLSPAASIWAPSCPYHRTLFLTAEGKQTNRSVSLTPIKKSWFVLPPGMAHYYRKNHAEYLDIPSYDNEVVSKEEEASIAILYPSDKQAIYIPSGLNGEQKSSVFKASHKNPRSKIFWHVDDKYLGATTEIHEMKINISPGLHKISLLDNNGIAVHRTFEVVGE
jgi:penicillin-binding protein 1C